MNEQKLYFVTMVHKILSSEHNFGLFVTKHACYSFPSVAEKIITFFFRLIQQGTKSLNPPPSSTLTLWGQN